MRDVFNEDFQKLVISGDDALATITKYVSSVAPDLVERIETYAGDEDAFDHYRISEQIEKALERKVWLPSGGSLIIDRTEAMTVIDVNTGKFVGSGGNLEETVTKNNLEAAEEIVRQLRLRDIGGIIVVDFIDMVLETNRDLVLRRVVECLSRDRTKHQVAEVTSLGLVQMTRKKLGLGLVESFSETCEVCAGRGIIVHHDPVFKHRVQQAEPGTGRRSRGRGNPPTQSAGRGPATGTHEITQDVRNALAQIAASTVPHPDHHDHEGAHDHDASPRRRRGRDPRYPGRHRDARAASGEPGCRSAARHGARGAAGAEEAGSGTVAPRASRLIRRNGDASVLEPAGRVARRVAAPYRDRVISIRLRRYSIDGGSSSRAGPAACRRRRSSRPVTRSAPSASRFGYCSSGTS